ARCTEVGAKLIFDEIQMGFGRSGEMFACVKFGVTPDIVCLAKALGGGMPLGAFVSDHDTMNLLTHNPVLGHITTFGGHPVCCAAGLAAMNYLEEHNLVGQAEQKGALFERLLADHPKVVEIRRCGLLLAVELGSSEAYFRLLDLFIEAGILSDCFLFCESAFRISPPLTISEQEIVECSALIRTCLDKL
ncbi:MAG: aminotransferase class III-fold pyridoxal phosphate-dependent enzyme, partial [Tidjanibacter sp.]|nr:aminotransferase class III-fold pyridoxal phosphate-dependent enzyme [Tidjanibacter sp.]